MREQFFFLFAPFSFFVNIVDMWISAIASKVILPCLLIIFRGHKLFAGNYSDCDFSALLHKLNLCLQGTNRELCRHDFKSCNVALCGRPDLSGRGQAFGRPSRFIVINFGRPYATKTIMGTKPSATKYFISVRFLVPDVHFLRSRRYTF